MAAESTELRDTYRNAKSISSDQVESLRVSVRLPPVRPHPGHEYHESLRVSVRLPVTNDLLIRARAGATGRAGLSLMVPSWDSQERFFLTTTQTHVFLPLPVALLEPES